MNEMNLNHYAVVPMYILLDKELTANAKLLYGCISSLTNMQGYCWASNDYFAKIFEVHKSTISSWISQLNNLGYVKTVLKYKPNSKEVESRFIYINPQITCKNTQSSGGILKNGVGYTEKRFRGILKNGKDNNKKQIINNINKQDEPSSPSANTSKKSSKLFSGKSKSVKLTAKQEKWLNHKYDILDRYNFREDVMNAYENFLRGLAESNTLFPDNAIIVQLDMLNNRISDNDIRLKIIMDTIASGWKSIKYAIDNLDRFSNSFDTSSKIDQNVDWDKMNKERNERLQREYQEAKQKGELF